MDKKEIISWLHESSSGTLSRLFREADICRHRYVGDFVHVRGVIEFSNYCSKNCLYCGLRRSNSRVHRYRLSLPEIYACAEQAKKLRIPTVVLQSGEDPGYSIKDLCLLVAKIKKRGLTVTVSIGERSFFDYRQLKEAGADRYLLRFETSNALLYRRLKPDSSLKKRITCIMDLRKLGYETGSGSMVGLPGQSIRSLASDIFLFAELGLDMIGVGPFIPHPDTPLAKAGKGSSEMVLKAVALTRLVTKDTNIPATTALGTIDTQGRQKALCCGANVIMPNLTPREYRVLYQIYPDKICISEDSLKCRQCVEAMVTGVGRKIARGPGNRRVQRIVK